MVFIKDINLSLNILIKILFLKLSFLSVLIAPVVESLTTSNIEGDEYFVAFALFNGTDILEDRDELVPTDFNNNSQGQVSYPVLKVSFRHHGSFL